MKIKAPFKIKDCGFMGFWLLSWRFNWRVPREGGGYRWMYCAPQRIGK